MTNWPRSIEVIDSHTEGEPTRVVISGWPLPAGETMAERRESARREQDHLRRAVVLEPRGHDAMVGALLTPPIEADSQAGVIFFDNATYLGMCGHGSIGVARTLQHLGRSEEVLRLDTPAGTIEVELGSDGAITIANVAPRVLALDLQVDVPGLGPVVGDVVYGGNWFFLTSARDEPLVLAHTPRLTAITQAIAQALDRAGVRGDDGALVDHVALFGAMHQPEAIGRAPEEGVQTREGRNFVLCPGGAFDRSPCGTGTSAKLASLHARGQLAIGQRWTQQSIVGGSFEAWLTEADGRLVPHVKGRAHITGQSRLLLDSSDPFRAGFQG
jgi:proline racemase